MGKVILATTLSVAIGIILGLMIAWVVWPVEYYEGPPSALKEPLKEEYVYLISIAYAQDGNLERASSRLKSLGLSDPNRAVIEVARKFKGRGVSQEQLQPLAVLAYALGAMEPELQAYLPSPTPPPTPVPIHTSAPETPLPIASPTPTPTLKPEASFILKMREMRCHTEEEAPMLEVEVLDKGGEPLPGVEVVVSWEGGEDRLFTGLKPDKSPGYTDFEMSREFTYQVKVNVPGSEEAGGLVALSGECPPERPLSSWHIVFQEK